MPRWLLRWRLRRWLGFGLVVLICVWLGLAVRVSYRLTGRAGPRRPEPAPPALLAGVESVTLTTNDGETLGAWWLRGRSDRAVVVYLHGNGGGRSQCVGPAEFLLPEGFGLFAPTLRAHGDSTGELNDFGFSARNDVQAAVDWVQRHAPRRRILIFGQSLGAAAALFAAGDLDRRVSGYVLESPYESLARAARNRTRASLPLGIEYVAYVGLRIAAPMVIGDIDKICPADAAQAMPPNVPVLILAGDLDYHATVDEAQCIADRLGKRCRLITIPGAGHWQLATCDPVRYRAEILRTISQAETGK